MQKNSFDDLYQPLTLETWLRASLRGEGLVGGKKSIGGKRSIDETTGEGCCFGPIEEICETIGLVD